MTDAERVIETKNILQEWADQQGHERCWYYPDLFHRLIALHEVEAKTEPCLPPLDEFKRGCERYQREEFRLSADLPLKTDTLNTPAGLAARPGDIA